MPFCFFRPNIVGKAAWAYMGITNVESRGQYEGALHYTSETINQNRSFNGTAESSKPNLVGLDASRNSNVYVTGAVLQPAALQVFCCIKT